ncbi:DUF1566 domain-containing protein [Paraburkholderia unamae]|uniref:DUF1566 domain-containing protein n=1 Tax=Paraburkholderia unamae TaxID=219649 RepID=A0ABX5K9Q5_9BURK|nr:DUF1566 domain-containing protein [Paraburkholderia unamae]PVX61273.1 hypothetical protein C7402_14266 [Paraburkholderia unamae]
MNAQTTEVAAIALPELAEGEIYVGLIGDATRKAHHVILLPGDNDGASWNDQIEWAKSIGGDLPNRIEQAMLWANHRDQFKKDWYWSNEEESAGWAWFQLFSYGTQHYLAHDGELRARAVRRLFI